MGVLATGVVSPCHFFDTLSFGAFALSTRIANSAQRCFHWGILPWEILLLRTSLEHDIVIIGAARTALGRFQGSLAAVGAVDLGAVAIREAVRRAGVEPGQVDEVLMGNVLQAGLGQAPARQASIRAGLPSTVGATTINKVCGSGLKTVMLGAAMIAAGDAQLVVAGGMESMTNAPYLLPQARSGYRLGDGELVDSMVRDGLWCTFEGQHMGLSAEWIAKEFSVSREAMDAYALESHRRAAAALDAGAFALEVAPVGVPDRRGEPHTFATDECPRRDTDMAKLSSLSPAFAKDGRVTAGNASSISDGAAALVVSRPDRAMALGCQPMARIVAYGQAAVDPLEVFTAPVKAVKAVLSKASRVLDDMDLVEINEAFAAQAEANLRELRLDHDRVNVRGGAIALGHPIGASGARILVTLLHEMRDRGAETGLAAACLGGGEAVAIIVQAE